MDKLLKINESCVNSDSFLTNLNDLDTFLKENESFRTQTPNEFYQILFNKLETSLEIEPKNWSLLRLIMKCIKNSAAAFKTTFSQSESDLCEYLYKKILEAFNSEKIIIFSKCLNSDDEFQFYQSILQYYFNLIQGNQLASDANLTKWVQLSQMFLFKSNIKQEIYDLASMIVIYGCKEKYKNEILLDKIAKDLTLSAYLTLIENLEQSYMAKSLNQKFTNWTFKFLDHFFDFVYCNHLVNEKNLEDLNHKIRFFLIYHINDRIMDIKEHRIQKNYLSLESLGFLCRFFTQSIKDLLFLIDQVDLESLDSIINALKEVKMLANILSDILTMEETRLFGNRYMVEYVQDQIDLFKLTCKLFREIHVNKEYLSLVDKYSKNSDLTEWFSLKCELVRVIGILVYENEHNQNYLVNDDLLHIISSNLSLDIDNPFVREWSIVALKHILANLDKK
ncbi:unnamed protein product [Brachionus calyciflorus]|uniref:Ataxin-10 domain-containing protein n=1 Tax=Brachionus calyciflorus TaxID=104777 RepID=A0A813MNK6_9BILA|nr:unnamed protein product [Brachionus calyciflorus]